MFDGKAFLKVGVVCENDPKKCFRKLVPFGVFWGSEHVKVCTSVYGNPRMLVERVFLVSGVVKTVFSPNKKK
jgi:hypothetical protein